MTKQEKTVCTVDPVCNLDLESQHGKFMYDFEDVTYYFCSELWKMSSLGSLKNFLRKKGSESG